MFLIFKVARLERSYHQAKRELDKINKELNDLNSQLEALGVKYEQVGACLNLVVNQSTIAIF